MKKSKKILTLVMALAMSASVLPMAFAEGEATDEPVEETTCPEIWMYRDYEDYTKGNGIFNPDTTKYGRKKYTGKNDWLNASVAGEGVNGKNVAFSDPVGDKKDGTWGAIDVGPIETGKLYIAFDVARKSDEYFTNAGVTETKNGINLLSSSNAGSHAITFYTGKSDSTKVYEPGADAYNLYSIGNIPAGNQRLEVIFDLDADLVTTYLNGKEVAEATNTAKLQTIKTTLSHGMEYIDNFAIIYYPQNVEPQTFSMKAGDIDYEDDTVSAVFVSDAVDNYVQETTTTVYKAPYGVSLVEEDLTDSIAVINSAGEEMEIKSIARTAKSGEYEIKLADDIADGENYIVTTKSQITDILGATLNADAAFVALPVNPEVWMYRDYEDYNGGSAFFNPDAKYGREELNASGDFAASSQAVRGVNGKAVGFTNAGTGKGNWSIQKDSEPITTGKMYVSFDIARKSDEYFTDADGNPTSTLNAINFMRSASSGKWVYIHTGHSDYEAEYTNNATVLHRMENIPEGNQKIEIIFDLDADLVTIYRNGELISECENTSNIVRLRIDVSHGIEYLDNLTAVYYPENVAPQTFSLNAGDVSFKNKTLSVEFLSDAKDIYDVTSTTDENGETTYSTKAYKAPYGVSLTEADLSGAVTVYNSLGDEVAVESVVKGDKTGEYEIKLAEDIQVGEIYTVSVDKYLTDVLGAEFTGNMVEITPKAPEFTKSVRITANKKGAALTDELKAELEAGDKVYAEITYKNTTEEDKSIVLLGASYAEGRMTDVNYKTVTASGEIKDTVKEYIEIDITDITELDIKAFLWDSLVTIKPEN